MKKILLYISVGFLSFITNFLLYNFSFNSQATPFLHEEQRVDSAILMLKITLPAYFISALIITFIFYYIGKNKNQS